MASIQIPNLPAVIGLNGTELFEGVQAGSSVKISLNQMIAAARGGTPATLPIPVSLGGTGVTTLTGYVKGSGTSPFTASPTIPNTDITGLGTMSTQDASNVAITGGTAALTGASSVTANSSFAALRVTQTGIGNSFVVEDSTNPDSTPFVVDPVGNVGIGTSTGLTKKLNLASDTYDAATRMTNSANTLGFEVGLLAGTADATAYVYQRANSPMLFGTNNSTRMTIDASGNVGIGTTTPSRALNVASVNNILAVSGSFTLPYTVTGAEPLRIGNFVNTNFIPGSSSVGNAVGFTISNFNTLSDGSGSTYLQAGVDSGYGGIQLQARKTNTGVVQRLADFSLNTSQFFTNDTERFRIASAGQLGIAGANYGTTGQTIVSAGAAAAPAWGTLPVAGGGTGATTGAGAFANMMGYTTTATAAGTTTLTNTSTQYQLFTGATTQTITLPVTSTLTTGWTFHIVNNSTGNLTVNASSGALVCTVIPNTTAMVTCISTAVTDATAWEFGFTDFGTITGTGAVVLASGATITGAALNGTVGATTASTGAFTTLSASSTVSGTGFSTYLASPPAIGGTAAAGGAFTSLTSTSGGINGTVGAATPNTGAFTTVTASTSVLSTGAGGIGYATGAGVAVTQATSRTTTTPTTGAKTTGAVTLFTTTAVVGTYFSFTVPNTAIAVTDTVVLSVRGATNTYVAFVTAITAATSFQVTMASVAGTASDTPIVNFTIIKGVSA